MSQATNYLVTLFIAVTNLNGYHQSVIQLTRPPYGSIYPNLPTVSTIPQSSARSTQSPILPPIDTLLPDGREHPCYRPCDGRAMTCYYHFHVEWYQSMSKACYRCPFNATDCQRKDCVPANGVTRPITVVNRKMPGPSIQACQNDRIVVDVENGLMASGTTVHWHGMIQVETPYMDGTPFVTQCPIQPESTFRYDFKASQAGTHFWHSHIGLQRGDGVAGNLIIRQQPALNPHCTLYDVDLPEHVLLITDWINRLTVGFFTEHYHQAGGNSPTTLLINGRGRFEIRNGNATAEMQAPRFEVQKGLRYRFRVINAEFLNCPVEISVDGHDITVIASDGSDLKPVTASSLVTYAGERYDFILTANQNVDNYWLRVRGILGCENSVETRQVGVLHYKGAKDAEPARLTWDNLPRKGLQVNSVNQGEEQNNTLTISKMRSVLGNDDSLKPVPDQKFYIAYDLYSKSNSHFNRLPFYGIDQVSSVSQDFRVLTPQLNHISMKLPSSPLLVSRPSSVNFCNESTVSESCKKDYCQCSHVLNIKLNSVVEIIIIDEGATTDTNHPFHLHGHGFRVIGQRRLDNRTTVEKIKAFDKAGLMARNLRNPPYKDTVTVPDGGYTIIRFKADNPGFWLFHCHIEFHAEIGMALVFKVGENEDMKPVPDGFPKCGNFNSP